MTKKIKVALLGAGSVGSQVARILLENNTELAERVGAEIELVGILVSSLDRPRSAELPKELFTTDAESLMSNANVVIELIGGLKPARELLLKAFELGADVITANKALLASHGPELYAAADKVGAQLFYEAAVGGAIPIVRPLRESLSGDRVNKILGIVNGTTNYILDRMDSEGDSMEQALALATELGYAEADPSADLSGADAAAKAAILASLAFHTQVPLDSVHFEGIESVTAADVAAAKEAGLVVKLLAICERISNGNSQDKISVRVHPALISRQHPLASVRKANNAVFINATAAGDLMFYGAGAGGKETASAVLGDLITVARRRIAGGPGVNASSRSDYNPLPFSEIVARYQIRLKVRDQPGVLAEIATIFSQNNVSVERVFQTPNGAEGSARLTIGTHQAVESAFIKTVEEISKSPVVAEVESFLRVEGV